MIDTLDIDLSFNHSTIYNQADARYSTIHCIEYEIIILSIFHMDILLSNLNVYDIRASAYSDYYTVWSNLISSHSKQYMVWL